MRDQNDRVISIMLLSGTKSESKCIFLLGFQIINCKIKNIHESLIRLQSKLQSKVVQENESQRHAFESRLLYCCW